MKGLCMCVCVDMRKETVRGVGVHEPQRLMEQSPVPSFLHGLGPTAF